MNFKRSAFLFLISLVLFLVTGCSEKKEKPTAINPNSQSVKTRIIDWKITKNLSALHEGIKFTSTPNCAAFDNDGDMYYRDYTNLQFIKIPIDGKLYLEIGKEGDNPENFNSPAGIFSRDNILYILDRQGQTLKHFCPDGSYRYEFSLEEKVDTVSSIFVDNKNIYLIALYKDPAKFTKRKLVTVLSKEGKFITAVGEPIKTKDVFGYYIFNRSFIAVKDERIYIAFHLLPLIVGYDLSGNEIIRVDLRQKNMHEINSLDIEAVHQGVVNNKTAKGPSMRAMIYCDGFAVDKDGDFYYACRKSFYRFDKNFNLKTRYTFTPVRGGWGCFQIIVDMNGNAWGLVSKAGQIHRFRFPNI